MKDEKKNCKKCDPCEERFKKEVDKLVGEVKDYSHMDHEQKKHEVEDAFDTVGKKGK